METLAGLAGGTLGYIYGNLPGAYYGYKLGKAMAPYRSLSRGRSRTPKRIRLTSPRSYSAPTPGSMYRPRLLSYSRSRSSRGGSDNFVTRQFDVTNQYRKRKMPYRKKRRWRSFVKKVAAVQIKQAGLRTVLFNTRAQVANGVTYQGAHAMELYGMSGTNDNNNVQGCSDIRRIFKNDPDITKEPLTNEPKEGKLQFGSGVLDATIRNLSEFEAEVDIYTGWFRKSQDNAAAIANRNIINDLGTAGDPINTGNTTLNLGERGATVFDLSEAISKTGYKIYSKKKMVLAPGQSTFIQHRDPKNHMIDWVRDGQFGYAKKGLTYCMLVVFKPTTTAVDDAVVTLSIGCTRKYSYAFVSDNLDLCAKNPPT